MEVNGQIGFYVRFLGGFSLWFEGRELPVKANPLGKTMQMLFLLLKAGSSGCEKKELLDLVRPGEKNRERQLNNFRQQLYMMRKLITASHFPEGKYIVYRGTRYYFTLDYPVRTDTEKLDNLIGEIRSSPGKGKELEQHCREYCEGYTGEFLPLLGGEEWVALESAYYQKWYFTCLNKLCVRLKEEKQFETLLHLAETASQIHPYDEWQVVQIDCLMMGSDWEGKSPLFRAVMPAEPAQARLHPVRGLLKIGLSYKHLLGCGFQGRRRRCEVSQLPPTGVSKALSCSRLFEKL